MNPPPIEWGFAEQPLPGEPVSGDRCVVQVADGRATIAVIDGIGHGSEAAQASRAVVDVLESHAEEPIVALFRLCHARLRSTRGAAMTVARYDAAARKLKWLGAGNVRAIMLRAMPDGATDCREMLIYSGIVGVRLPTVEISRMDARPGDVLFLATDGIRNGFEGALRHGEEPRAQAERLLGSFRSYTDDALVLVARITR